MNSNLNNQESSLNNIMNSKVEETNVLEPPTIESPKKNKLVPYIYLLVNFIFVVVISLFFYSKRTSSDSFLGALPNLVLVLEAFFTIFLSNIITTIIFIRKYTDKENSSDKYIVPKVILITLINNIFLIIINFIISVMDKNFIDNMSYEVFSIISVRNIFQICGYFLSFFTTIPLIKKYLKYNIINRKKAIEIFLIGSLISTPFLFIPYGTFIILYLCSNLNKNYNEEKGKQYKGLIILLIISVIIGISCYLLNTYTYGKKIISTIQCQKFITTDDELMYCKNSNKELEQINIKTKETRILLNNLDKTYTPKESTKYFFVVSNQFNNSNILYRVEKSTGIYHPLFFKKNTIIDKLYYFDNTLCYSTYTFEPTDKKWYYLKDDTNQPVEIATNNITKIYSKTKHYLYYSDSVSYYRYDLMNHKEELLLEKFSDSEITSSIEKNGTQYYVEAKHPNTISYFEYDNIFVRKRIFPQEITLMFHDEENLYSLCKKDKYGICTINSDDQLTFYEIGQNFVEDSFYFDEDRIYYIDNNLIHYFDINTHEIIQYSKLKVDEINLITNNYIYASTTDYSDYKTKVLIINKPKSAKEKNPTSLTKVKIGAKTIKLKPGDQLDASAWNSKEITLNEKPYYIYPRLYGGITIGSNVEKVVKAFDIKSGYAIVNREVASKERDGTTEVVIDKYKNLDFLSKEPVLDAILIFGYKNVDNKLIRLTAEELLDNNKKEPPPELANQDILLYRIDINGSAGEQIERNAVISIRIEYQKGLKN